jgi:hypothetical protein
MEKLLWDVGCEKSEKLFGYAAVAFEKIVKRTLHVIPTQHTLSLWRVDPAH